MPLLTTGFVKDMLKFYTLVTHANNYWQYHNTQTKSKTQNAHKYTISSLKYSNTVKNINTNSPCALRIAAFPLPAPDPWFLFFILFNIGAFFNMSGKIRKRILLPRM